MPVASASRVKETSDFLTGVTSAGISSCVVNERSMNETRSPKQHTVTPGVLSGFPVGVQRSVSAVVDRWSAASSADVAALGWNLALAWVATGPAAATALSLRWEWESLEVSQFHPCKPDGRFQVLAILRNGCGISALLGFFGEQLVSLPGRFDFWFPLIPAQSFESHQPRHVILAVGLSCASLGEELRVRAWVRNQLIHERAKIAVRFGELAIEHLSLRLFQPDSPRL